MVISISVDPFMTMKQLPEKQANTMQYTDRNDGRFSLTSMEIVAM